MSTKSLGILARKKIDFDQKNSMHYSRKFIYSCWKESYLKRSYGRENNLNLISMYIYINRPKAKTDLLKLLPTRVPLATNLVKWGLSYSIYSVCVSLVNYNQPTNLVVYILFRFKFFGLLFSFCSMGYLIRLIQSFI